MYNYRRDFDLLKKIDRKMKPLSEKIIKPIFEADIDKGRINRKAYTKYFFYRYR